MTEPWATLRHISEQRDVQLQAEINELRPRALASDETLDHLRAKLRRESPPEPLPFKRPGRDEFFHNQAVLAFDPSLMHTGFVQVYWASESTIPWADTRLTIDLKTALKGYWATWDAAYQLQRELRDQVFKTRDHWRHLCALEAPSIGGGNLRRTDSSLVAGTIIYAEATARGMTVREVSPNHVSSVLTGKKDHDKKEIAAAVASYFPDAREWTEAECDAAAVGLTVLYDMRRQ